MTRKLTQTLLALLAIFVFGLTNEANAATPHEIKDIIVKTAVQMGVDPCVALSIAKQESNFQSHKQNPSGAVGVFQLMPSTARRMGLNPYNLNENVKGGIMYYQMMYKKFGSVDLALAAYNAGPGNVAKYKGVPPFRETQRFINVIKSGALEYKNDPIVLKHTAAKAAPVNNSADASNAADNNETSSVFASANDPVTPSIPAVETGKIDIKDEKAPIVVPNITL